MSRRNTRGNRQVTVVDTTETDIATASTIGNAHDIYMLLLTNTSAATAVTASIYDGGLSAGTKKFVWAIPAGQSVGFTLPADDAIKAANRNTAWTVILSGAVTSIEITCLYTRRPIVIG